MSNDESIDNDNENDAAPADAAPTPRTAPLLNVGASKASIAEARAAINDILNAPHVETTARIQALQTLRQLCLVNNTMISGCNFQG